MATKEVENGLVWNVKCRECKSYTGGKGIKSLTQAENWIVEHSKETGHLRFNMNAGLFAIVVTNITEEKPVGEIVILPDKEGENTPFSRNTNMGTGGEE